MKAVLKDYQMADWREFLRELRLAKMMASVEADLKGKLMVFGKADRSGYQWVA
jgi:hypothetical protein